MFKKITVFIFFLSIGSIYLHNLTRDIYSGDIGDLVTAAYVGGVAHPPGYPLFSLLGFILSHLPLPLPVVSRVGLISVFSSLIGLVIYYKFAFKVTKSVFLSLLSTSILAFSYLFWLTAEVPEGLGLNNFFAIVILYLSLKFYESKKTKYLYLLALFAGLSMTNQLNIITLFPAVIILILTHRKYIFSNKRFLFALLFFLLGYSIYIYVPIAASRNPPINWDNATNLKNFLRLILRADYGGLAPKKAFTVPFEVRIINVIDYLKTIVLIFSYQVLFLALLGLVQLFKKNKTILLALCLAFLFSGILSIFYTAATISVAAAWGILERYYTLSTVVLMFVVPYGFVLIRDFLNSKFSKPIYSYLLIGYFLIIPILLLKYNFPKTDLSKTKIGNNLARNVFSQVPKNSVLFVTGDNTTFSIWYLYYVLKERQDIDIINPPGVGNNLYLDKEINDFYKKHPDTQLKDVIAKTFDVIRKKRRMFTTYEINPMPKGTILIPKGLVFEIINTEDFPNEEDYLASMEKNWSKVKVQRRETLALAEQNFIASEIPFIYSMGLVRVGNFLNDRYNKPKKAEYYYRRALWIDDSNPQAYSGLALSQFKGYADCSQSIENMKKAITLYPIWKMYYLRLYTLYDKCGVDIKIRQKFKAEYKNLFREEIDVLLRPARLLDTNKKN